MSRLLAALLMAQACGPMAEARPRRDDDDLPDDTPWPGPWLDDDGPKPKPYLSDADRERLARAAEKRARRLARNRKREGGDDGAD